LNKGVNPYISWGLSLYEVKKGVVTPEYRQKQRRKSYKGNPILETIEKISQSGYNDSVHE
jgi:hypothetical protein